MLDEEAQIEGVHLGGGWGEVHLIRAGRLSESGTPPRDCPSTHPRNFRRERIVWAGSARFPRTLRLLRSSGAEFLNARLSVLRPGTHITPHCGESSAFRSG